MGWTTRVARYRGPEKGVEEGEFRPYNGSFLAFEKITKELEWALLLAVFRVVVARVVLPRISVALIATVVVIGVVAIRAVVV